MSNSHDNDNVNNKIYYYAYTLQRFKNPRSKDILGNSSKTPRDAIRIKI